MTDFRRNNPRRGMTLIECAFSIAVVSLMLVAAMSAVGTFGRARRSQFERCVGSNLARALMSEILRCRYLEPGQEVRFGRESGESSSVRSAWDDVDDYDGLIETPPTSQAGSDIVGAEGWTRKVAVEYVEVNNPSILAGEDTGLVRITVWAISPTGVTTTLQALRGDQSIFDQTPSEQTRFVTWVVTQMQIGTDDSKRLTTGTHILNRHEVSD